MRLLVLTLSMVPLIAGLGRAVEPPVLGTPDFLKTLVNPTCSHCRDEAVRRAVELKPGDRVLAWTRGYSDGGAIPFRFFLNAYPVISDSYGVFVADPDAGFARGFAPSYEFRAHGWRNGVMVMAHKDGTLYSCLTGVAFDGPKKGTRLTPVPTVVSDWGWWLDKYPNAVAYQMLDKYKPVDLPAGENADAVASRGKPDPRLKPGEAVLGVSAGTSARAYPIEALAKAGFLADDLGGAPLAVLWEPTTRTASAYRPVASPPRKFKGPAPDATGVSPTEPTPPTVPTRTVTLGLAAKDAAGRFQDAETKSFWDVAGRCVAGELAGHTLEWVDSVQVKWFAWSAEYPAGTVAAPKPAAPTPAQANAKVKALAGTAEFLRLLPKPFGTVKGIDAKARTVTLLLDGETEAKTWPLEPDAEVKVAGWWGRLDQFQPGDRVWAWLKLDRKKTPVAVVMLADAATEFDMHASLRHKPADAPKFTAAEIDGKRTAQKAWLRQRWTDDGLPGTLTFLHLFSGELELTLDHEAMRWGRSLNPGDAVRLQADPPIKAVVKAVTPWRERTVLRLVVGELESSELKIGQRLALGMTPPTEAVEASVYPPDIDRPRSKAERVEWFLASTYCTCGVSKDTCTGHFYTLASCNPNGCGMPDHRRGELAAQIDRGLTDRQIFDALLKEAGPYLLKPHLQP
jgi:hypothetical protein